MIDFILQHALSWLLLIGALLFSVYALFVIKNEVQTYKDDSAPIRIGRIEIDIANWWTLVKTLPQGFRYERTDGRYEWFGKFECFNPSRFIKIEDIFDSYIKEQDIALDPDSIVTTESSHIFKEIPTRKAITECVRVEGKGSQHNNKRIYWDLYIFRIGTEKEYYQFESWSSVLNGMLEGPFFEEAVSLIRLIPDAEPVEGEKTFSHFSQENQ